MNTTTTPASRNSAHGFSGTMDLEGNAAEAWPIAVAKIAAATGETPEAARTFLDSRLGRHFADDVNDNLAAAGHRGSKSADAIMAATDKSVATWQAWKIHREESREHGIPRGLAYLTGWVAHFGIENEIEDEA